MRIAVVVLVVGVGLAIALQFRKQGGAATVLRQWLRPRRMNRPTRRRGRAGYGAVPINVVGSSWRDDCEPCCGGN